MSAAAASTTLRALAALCAGCAASISFAHAETDQERYQAAERLAVEHIALYRTADFDVFTNQKWDRIQESHLRAMFVYAPDSRIRQHAVEFATQEWSSIVGILEGTFTQHMPTPDGKTIPPTGKPFKVVFSAVDHWKDGLIDEQFLFWDNLTFMRQVGLAP